MQDLLLLDFYERKTKDRVLLDGNILQNIIISQEDITKPTNVLTLYSNSGIYLEIPGNMDFYIKNFLESYYPEIYQVLLLGNGNISICGICIIDLLVNWNFSHVNLFFHCDISLAKDLLLESIEILGSYDIMCSDNYIMLHYEHCTVKFCLDVYTDEDDTLRNINTTAARHGYNPVKKYFTTLSGAISLKGKISFINVNHKIILTKYTLRGFNICFPGLALNNDVKVLENNFRIKKMFKRISIEEIKLRYANKKIAKPYIIQNYIPRFIGITDDRYVALSGIKRKYSINDDIFKMLCDYWLEAEVLGARGRLLSLN